jgi:hypothetical protein
MTCVYERRQRLLPLLSYGPDPLPNGPSQKWWLGPFHLDAWLKRTRVCRERTNLRRGSERLSGVSLKVDLPMKLHFRSIEEIVL